MKKRAAMNPVNLIRILFCLGVLLLLGFKGQAQGKIKNLNGSPLLTYANGLGLRLGSHNGLTYKHFMRDANALEFMITSHYDKKGILGTFMFEWHRNAFEARNLMWLYGAGAHLGTYKYKDYYSAGHERYNKDGYFPIAGVDVIVGLEYKFPNLPLAVSADMKPALNLIGGNTGAVDGAFTIKYTFE